MPDPTSKATVRRPRRIYFDLAVLSYLHFNVRAMIFDGEAWFMLHDLQVVERGLQPSELLRSEGEIIRVPTADLGNGRTRLDHNMEDVLLVSEPGAIEMGLRHGSITGLELARWIMLEAGPTLRNVGLSEVTLEMLPIRRHRIDVSRPANQKAQRHHVVYRFYNEADELLYVGLSLDGVQRMATHQATKRWWGAVARVEFEHHPDKASAREAERRAIQDESPLYNIAS